MGRAYLIACASLGVRGVGEPWNDDGLGAIAVVVELVDDEMRHGIGQQLGGILHHEAQARDRGDSVVRRS